MESINLQYQLEKLKLNEAAPPSPEQWQHFLRLVNGTYQAYEKSLSANK